MSYSLEKVNYISIIGDFNDWAGDVDLTYKRRVAHGRPTT